MGDDGTRSGSREKKRWFPRKPSYPNPGGHWAEAQAVVGREEVQAAEAEGVAADPRAAGGGVAKTDGFTFGRGEAGTS